MNYIRIVKGFILIFAVLAVCGMAYLFLTKGTASPGYVILPMVLATTFCSIFQHLDKDESSFQSNHGVLPFLEKKEAQDTTSIHSSKA